MEGFAGSVGCLVVSKVVEVKVLSAGDGGWDGSPAVVEWNVCVVVFSLIMAGKASEVHPADQITILLVQSASYCFFYSPTEES